MKPRGRRQQSRITPQELISRDTALLPILDNWWNKAQQRAGHHLACRPGCAQCCIGVFPINRLDALRLQRGLSELAERDLPRAERILQRAADSLDRIAELFPGDLDTGILDDSQDAEEIFDEYANDEPCPALDPQTLTCDLYAHRPMTCRVFGPPIRSEGGIGVCELCFTTATQEDIIAAEVPLEGEREEEALNRQLERVLGEGQTIVALALLRS